MSQVEQEKILRAVADSVQLDESFVLRGESDIAQQYFELYKHRLLKLRPSLIQSVQQKWGKHYVFCFALI